MINIDYFIDQKEAVRIYENTYDDLLKQFKTSVMQKKIKQAIILKNKLLKTQRIINRMEYQIKKIAFESQINEMECKEMLRNV